LCLAAGALGCEALGLNLAPADDVGLVLRERRGKHVSAGAVCNEEERVRFCGVRGCFERRATRICDRCRRQAVDAIRIVPVFMSISL
jgi:hypothetical protein